MDTKQQVELVDEFIEQVVHATADKVYEDIRINSKNILDVVASPILMDIFRLYKNGASKIVITEELQEAKQVYKTIYEVVTAMLDSSIELLAEDENYYTKQETTNATTD